MMSHHMIGCFFYGLSPCLRSSTNLQGGQEACRWTDMSPLERAGKRMQGLKSHVVGILKRVCGLVV